MMSFHDLLLPNRIVPAKFPFRLNSIKIVQSFALMEIYEIDKKVIFSEQLYAVRKRHHKGYILAVIGGLDKMYLDIEMHGPGDYDKVSASSSYSSATHQSRKGPSNSNNVQ